MWIPTSADFKRWRRTLRPVGLLRPQHHPYGAQALARCEPRTCSEPQFCCPTQHRSNGCQQLRAVSSGFQRAS
eukprot:15445460-Alexandrium_andersonii.AAC.1